METLVVAGRVALSLGAVLAVIWFAQSRITRRRPARKDKDVIVLSRTGIGSKASVVAIESGGRRFLLGVTDHSIQVIHTEALVSPVPAVADPALEPADDDVALALDDASAVDAFDEFDRLLAEAALHTEKSAAATDADEPLLRRRARDHVAPEGVLAGSILSPTTWKQTAAFIRQRR